MNIYTDALNMAENIVRFRHEKKITQEQLASFLGVTKAAVSKWETRQSTPDIMLLPRLAAFFDVTVDELIGYEPQLSKEQIQKLYQEFAAEFAEKPFEQVMERTRDYVKRYYSCYPFLFQICVLWLNHYMLVEDQDKHRETLLSILDLSGHIKKNCRDVEICNDSIVLQALVNLQLKRAQEAVDALEEMSKPYSMSRQKGSILTQAYMMLGLMDKADSFIQVSMYHNILSLMDSAAKYIAIHINNVSVSEQTIDRIEQVISVYNLASLHPNNTALFEYQAALFYLTHGDKQKALIHSEKYVSCLERLFSHEQVFLYGDDYFNKLEEWFEQLGNGSHAPRNKKVVLEDIRQSFDNPAFDILEEEVKYESLKKKIKELK